MPIHRRDLLIAAPALVAATHAHAADVSGRFTHGVASGDPLAQRVMLWTRFETADQRPAQVTWEIARDEGFARVVARGSAYTSAARDFTVKVDAGGLQPGQRYFYRFRAGTAVSTTGRTRTLPRGSVDQLKIAVFSCSNYRFGYYNAYAHAAARDDLDLALHLGDYIYEHETGKYPAEDQALPGREIMPKTELFTLSDYRQRYATYRTDPDLQEIHRVLPFLVVWDDHESANDTWREGAENHQPNEGDWAIRKRAAIQAYYEWMPIREARVFGEIYRRFDWGNLASLLMLDTRMLGRDKQFSYRDDFTFAETPTDEDIRLAAVGFLPKLNALERTLLGEKQEAWLTQALTSSAAQGIVWQVLGQQILMGDRRVPLLNDDLLNQFTESGRRMLSIRGRLGAYGLPFKFDDWPGYPAAKHRVMSAAWEAKANLVSLAGDTHNAWAFELPMGLEEIPGGVEFGTTSVSSPGLESQFSGDPQALAAALVKANTELRWCDTSQRGYLTVTFSRETAVADWIFMRTIRERSVDVSATHQMRVEARNGPGIGTLS